MEKQEKLILCQKTFYSFLRSGSGRYLFTEEESYSFGETCCIAENLARKFYEYGVRKGDCVAVRATRCVGTAMILFALHILGGVCVCTDAHFSVAASLQAAGVPALCKFWITNESFGDDLSQDDGWSIAQGDKKLSFDWRAELKENEHNRAWAEKTDAGNSVRDPSLAIFTSGSTGKSKMVLLCQQNYIANSVDGGDLFGENPSDVNALVLPLHHIFGVALLVCAAVTAHAVYFPKDPSAEYLLSTMARYGVTVLYSVPTYFLQLAEQAERSGVENSALRMGVIAGGPSTQKQAERIERALHLSLIPVYGMSEYVGICSCAFQEPKETRLSGVGRFYPLNEGVILDENGRAVPIGTEGEICVSGPDLMLGYYDKATPSPIDAYGRLHTGDLGFMDKDGIVHVSGRKKELIICGGENLSVGKIETELMQTDGVVQAVVCAKSHPVWGEVPVAMVVLKADSSLTEETLKRALKGRLRSIEIPVRFLFVGQLPLTASGKPDRQNIKELWNRE